MSLMTKWDPPTDINEISWQTVEYELKRFSAEIYFAPEVLQRMEVEWVTRHASRETVMRIMGVVATWREERMLEVPANWWQHFKERFFPTWALKRWPVLVKTYDAAVVLPKVPIVSAAYHTVQFPVWNESQP